MSKVLRPAPPEAASAEDMKALDALRKDFPGWWIGRSEKRIGWDAKRKRGAFWTGGVWAVEAESAESLRAQLLEVQILDARFTTGASS
ncbi:hypothetical protein F8568_022500 [Actinomadura sp. LD22]|uniref:Uncharacterized protein n=1 Tax=Actinomadura physcomitrii TaxID=2650748 RepID=A0A6I4M9I0_9ACTN|nr:hypothetical protein [Actinomadura physcomitrii]MWA02333.1 hypothetical protein [Actinomadura physcomitrii]MWA03095.1 hypothetical protein [Actinomadura physcomitrii]